jgi:hypothetical protein
MKREKRKLQSRENFYSRRDWALLACTLARAAFPASPELFCSTSREQSGVFFVTCHVRIEGRGCRLSQGELANVYYTPRRGGINLEQRSALTAPVPARNLSRRDASKIASAHTATAEVAQNKRSVRIYE